MDTSVHEVVGVTFILFHRSTDTVVRFRPALYTSDRLICAYEEKYISECQR
jgi:hypothetical protein